MRRARARAREEGGAREPRGVSPAPSDGFPAIEEASLATGRNRTRVFRLSWHRRTAEGRPRGGSVAHGGSTDGPGCVTWPRWFPFAPDSCHVGRRVRPAGSPRRSNGRTCLTSAGLAGGIRSSIKNPSRSRNRRPTNRRVQPTWIPNRRSATVLSSFPFANRTVSLSNPNLFPFQTEESPFRRGLDPPPTFLVGTRSLFPPYLAPKPA